MVVAPLQAVQAVGYNEEESSDSEHDAYLERMKAEGGNYDSEDGKNCFLYTCALKFISKSAGYGF